jgi:anti-sigma factor RsiW
VTSSRNDSPSEPLIARDATYYKAPEALRTRIRAHVAEARRERERPRLFRWAGFGAAIVITGLLTWNGLMLQASTSPMERLAGEVEGAHVRSLLVDSHLNDVASTDQHTVKPWFQGRLNFAPQAPDLQEAGFTLTGGRLDYLNGRPVAALTFRHRLHVVNVFEWPSANPTESQPALMSRDGYSLVAWSHAGLDYWAISDAAGADLLQLASLMAR